MAGGDPGADEPGRAVGARRPREARQDHATYERRGGIEGPTQGCGGRYDGIAPPENMEAVAGQIPKAELEFFEGGHIFLQQDPAAWERIIHFLS
jgi:3-oxoadipate enol-lactonase